MTWHDITIHYIHIYIYTCVCVHVHIQTSIYIYIYIYIHIHIHIHIHTDTYTYIRIHTYTYIDLVVGVQQEDPLPKLNLISLQHARSCGRVRQSFPPSCRQAVSPPAAFSGFKGALRAQATGSERLNKRAHACPMCNRMQC